ncbi:MAG: amino acid ABC transporter substrate-binding protein [Vicinamibacteria bacterium]|nr:amino acid ABC transporter substrate-binding protein [Vicinamibacteria bacterium]
MIGFTASQTGKLNVESVRQVNGLRLWIDQINARGGIRLRDGSLATFEAKFYDDESNKDRVQSLYTRLIQSDQARFLISPYSSGLADAAAVIAEQYGRIMITTGAASDSTYKKGYTLVYQAYTPASRYLTGAFDLLATLDPTAKRTAFIHENDKFSSDVCQAARAYAEAKGLRVVLYEGYDTGATDFAPFINKIPPDVEAVMGGGHFADGSTFARQLREKGVKAKAVVLLVAPPEPQFAELGAAALGVIGPSQWEPTAQYKVAQAAGREWFGPTANEFVASYKALFHEEPSYHSAGGYAAGMLIERAIARAGTLDTAQVKAALDDINMLTFFGALRFDTSPAAHGLQIGHEMVYIQWQQDAAQKMIKQVIWPEAAQSAKPILLTRANP